MTLPMEKATYRARAVNTGLGESDNERATRFIAVGVEIVDDENYAGETITWLGYFTDKTTARTIESLQHMGFQSDDLSLLEETSGAQTAELLPTVVDIVCEPEEYNGQWQLKVQWVNRSGAGRFKAKKPLVGAEAKAFAAQLKSQFKNARGPQKKSAPAPSGYGGGGGSGKRDDDLPFAHCGIEFDPSPIARVLR